MIFFLTKSTGNVTIETVISNPANSGTSQCKAYPRAEKKRICNRLLPKIKLFILILMIKEKKMAIKGMDHIVVRVKNIDEGISTFRDKL